MSQYNPLQTLPSFGDSGSYKCKWKWCLCLVASALVLFQFVLSLTSVQESRSIGDITDAQSPRRVRIFIAIGSHPEHDSLRQAQRDTVLYDLMSRGDSEYRFFTEGNFTNHTDVILMPIEGGYTNFAKRAFYQMQWALDHYDFDYFLRIDDDGYICVDHFFHALQQAPVSAFFWGRYHCANGVVMADENFMLFTPDLINLIVQLKDVAKLGPNKATFASLFGMWHHMLNLTRWDDQQRFLWDELAPKYFNGTNTDNDLQSFCTEHLYSHHVNQPDRVRIIYQSQSKFDPVKSEPFDKTMVPNVICKNQQFNTLFNPSMTLMSGGDIQFKIVH